MGHIVLSSDESSACGRHLCVTKQSHCSLLLLQARPISFVSFQYKWAGQPVPSGRNFPVGYMKWCMANAGRLVFLRMASVPSIKHGRTTVDGAEPHSGTGTSSTSGRRNAWYSNTQRLQQLRWCQQVSITWFPDDRWRGKVPAGARRHRGNNKICHACHQGCELYK